MAVVKIITCQNEWRNKCPRKIVRKEGVKPSPCPKCGGERSYSDKWYVSLTIEGKKYFRAESTKKDEAIIKEALLLGQRRDGLGDRIMRRQYTVEEAYNELWEGYIGEQISDSKLSEGSATSYEYRLRLHVVPHLGHIKLHLLEHHMIKSYIRARKLEKDHRGNYPKPATINREITALMVLINAAIDARVINSDPLSGFSLLPEHNARDRVLSDKEIDRLLDCCKVRLGKNGKPSNDSPPDYLETMVVLALNTGLRKEGVLGLKWEHINWERGEIVRVVKHQRRQGEKKVRVPMTVDLEKSMIAWRDRGGVSRRFGLVFPSKQGDGDKPMLVTSNIGFESAVERAGLGKFCFHELRHTFVTHFIQAGNSLEMAGEIVGHGSAHMTKRYAHLMDEHKREAMQNFKLGGNRESKAR